MKKMNLETKWFPKPLFKYNFGTHSKQRKRRTTKTSQNNEMSISPWTPNASQMRPMKTSESAGALHRHY